MLPNYESAILDYAVYDVRARIVLPSLSMASLVAMLLPVQWVRVDGSGDAQLTLELLEQGDFAVRCNGLSLGDFSRREMAIDRLLSAGHHWVAEHACSRLFVHAAVARWRGQALILPGRSHAGKTTLIAALVAAGVEYYSDEYAVLDDAGRVDAYAKPLAMRSQDRADRQRQQIALPPPVDADLPIPVGWVVVTHYEAGESFAPKSLTRAEGLFAMIANTVPVRHRPRETLAVLARAMQNATALQSVRGEADATAELLLTTLAGVAYA
jgi:hypothetical protein